MLNIKENKMDNLMKQIKVFEIGEDSELTAISFVEYPAVETSYIALSKEPMKYITLEKEDKHIVYGCALRANYPIYRYDRVNDFEYFIKFSPKAIEKLSRDYMSNKVDNWTLDHNRNTDGISIIESWIKEDNKFDKSIALGLEDVEVGSWFIGAYVSNEDTWNSIKEGRWSGFSVEAMCQLVEEKYSKDMVKENLEQVEVNESFWDRLKSIISEALKMPATEEKEAEAAADEVVEEVKDEVVEEEVAMEKEVEEKVELESVEDEKEEAVELEKEEPVEEEVKEEEVNLQAVVDELNVKIAELESQIESLKNENIKLSKMPSAKPINSKGEVSEGSNFDKMLAIMDGSAFRK